MKILLIEDSKTLRRIIGGYVESAGHTLITAETGEIALQLLDSHDIDLILSDVDMPGLNSFDTVTLMREMLGEHWVPIIFVTSRDEDEDYLEGFAAGSDDYLVKPVREVVLKAKIKVMERFINMQNKLYELLHQQEPPSQFDDLTQVYNSHSFLHLAEIQWAVLERRNEQISLLMIGVDFIEEYAQYHGKDARDNVLRCVAKSIRQSVQRPNDFIGRVSKNDFLLMLPSTKIKGARQLAERIAKNVSELNIKHNASMVSGIVTVSVSGICCVPSRLATLEAGLDKASSLLNYVKNQSDEPILIQPFC